MRDGTVRQYWVRKLIIGYMNELGHPSTWNPCRHDNMASGNGSSKSLCFYGASLDEVVTEDLKTAVGEAQALLGRFKDLNGRHDNINKAFLAARHGGLMKPNSLWNDSSVLT